MVPLTVTLIWVTVSILSLALGVRSRRSRPLIPRWGTILVLAVEVAAIGIALLTAGTLPTQYPVVLGSALLVLGWLVSHERFLLRLSARAPQARRSVSYVYRFLGPRSTGIHPDLLGGWVQLVGFGLVWTSGYGLLIALTVIPIAVLLVTRRFVRTAGAERTADSWLRPLSAIWAGFRFLSRISFIAVLPVALVALLTRDVTIFWGTSQEASTLLATFAQVEATVGALVVTLLLVLVELTTSAYSPRLSRLLSTRPSFRAMITFAVLSLALKFIVLSNASHWMRLPDTGGESLLIDGVLLWSVLAGLGYVAFARDAFALMAPEAIVVEALKGFDSDWMQMVRHEWSSRLGPRSMHIARDPMVLIERMLVSALQRGDVNTFQASLILTRDRMQAVCGPHDGAVIDSYLSDRLASVVRVAADRRADVELEFLCNIAHEMTAPSPETLRSADVTSLDPPLGSNLLRLVVEHAIASHVPNSATRALYLIAGRATQAVMALPMLSDLWRMNREKKGEEISETERETLRKNDWRVDNYVHGYLYYLGKLGAKALEADMVAVSAAASTSLSMQVTTVLKHIQEEPYQRLLLFSALYNLGELVKGACTKRIVGAVDFWPMGLELKAVSHANIAMMISYHLSGFIIRMARAGTLDPMTVIDTALAALYMAENNPEVVLPILEAFGEAGESLHALDDFARREDLNYVIEEIHGRINQVEQAGLQPGIKTKVRRAASRARRRAKRRKASNH